MDKELEEHERQQDILEREWNRLQNSWGSNVPYKRQPYKPSILKSLRRTGRRRSTDN